MTYADSCIYTIRSSIFDNSDKIDIGRMSEGVIGTLILERAFKIDFFLDERKKPVVNDAFIISSCDEEIIPKTIFSIASDMLSREQFFEEDGMKTVHKCSIVADWKAKFSCGGGC